MPRPGLTYDEIAAAANSLNNKGIKPTIQNVREVLGDRGSPVTISKHLKAWKEGQKTGLVQPAAPAMPGKLSRRTVKPATNEPQATAQPSTPTENEPSNIQVETIAPLTNNTHNDTKPSTQSFHSEKTTTQPNTDKKIQNTPQPQEKNADNTSEPNHSHKKSFKKRERDTQPQIQKVLIYKDPLEQTAESLMGLSDDHLKVKILQLETAISKEQSRREAAEAMARDIKEYAELLKAEIQQRITDISESYDRTIAELKANAEQLRQNAAEDLKFYRSALEKANVKLSQK